MNANEPHALLRLLILIAAALLTACGLFDRATAPETAAPTIIFGPAPTTTSTPRLTSTPIAPVIPATTTPPTPVPERIQFPPGATSVTLEGPMDGETQVRYLAWAAAGQTMAVTVTSPNVGVLFHINGVQDNHVYKHLLDGEMSWQGVLPLSQDYLITLDAVGGATSYTLDVAITIELTPEPPSVRIQFPPAGTGR